MKFVAANAPREVVTAVRQKGLSSLPADQAAHLPPSIDAGSDEHMTFFKASFDDGDAMHGGMTDAAWKGMLAAQATWDGAMAWNAVKAFEQVASDPQSVVVVLVGSGHVAYGLGIERQARAYFHEPIASVIGMPIADEHGRDSGRPRVVRELHLGHRRARRTPPGPRWASRRGPRRTGAGRSSTSRRTRPPRRLASPSAISSSRSTKRRSTTGRR